MKFLADMFSNNENVSHKRVLGTLGFLALIVFMYVTKNVESVQAIEYITITMGIGSVAEKFTKRYSKQEK